MNPASHRTVLLATDSNQSIIAEIVDGKTNAIAYSAYGDQSTQQEVATRLGFNGQLREAKIDWYLLGKGYRAYNPRLMRFHSPDSWSPFGGGGLNAYMYCVGDPVNRSDPTGHVPWIEPVVKRFIKKAFNFLFGGADITGPRKLTRAQGGIIDSLGGMRPEKTNEGKALVTLGGAAMANAPEPRLTGVYPSPDVGTHGWTRNPTLPPTLPRASQPARSQRSVGFEKNAKLHDGPSTYTPKREHNQLQGGEIHPRRNHWPSNESISSAGSNQSTGSTFYSANSTNASNSSFGSAVSINSDRFERAAELRFNEELLQRVNALEREAGLIRRGGSNAGL